MYDYLNQSDSSERKEMNTPLNHLPEGCRTAKAIRDVCFRIAHVTRDHFGNYNERRGWLVMDVVCDDPSRICIRYDGLTERGTNDQTTAGTDVGLGGEYDDTCHVLAYGNGREITD